MKIKEKWKWNGRKWKRNGFKWKRWEEMDENEKEMRGN